jgi:DNA-binding PadR family transcriptional regulator
MDNCVFLKGKLKYLILLVLKTKPLHTYAIRKAIIELSQNTFKPSFGSIYPAIEDLLNKKQVKLKINNKKKEYFITTEGLKYLDNFSKNAKEFEKKAINAWKDIDLPIEPEEFMRLNTLYYKLAGDITKKYALESYNFLTNYSNGKLNKKDLLEFKNALINSYETIKKINEKYRD